MTQIIYLLSWLLISIIATDTQGAPPPFGYEDETPYLNFNKQLSVIAKLGQTQTDLAQPGIPYLDQQQVYIPDCHNKRIQVFDLKGIYKKTIQRPPWICPQALAKTATGDYWLLDRGSHSLYWLDPEFNIKATLGGFGKGPGQFNQPIDFVLKKDTLYIADTHNHRIQIIQLESAQSSAIKSIQVISDALGQTFNQPKGIAVANNGHIYLSDTYHHRIIVFDQALKALKSIGQFGAYQLEFHHPMALSIHQDQLFIADSQNHRIQIITPQGQFIAQWGYHPLHVHDTQDHIHNVDYLSVDHQHLSICDSVRSQCYILNKEDALTQQAPIDTFETRASHHRHRQIQLTPQQLIISEPSQHRVLIYAANDLSGVTNTLSLSSSIGQFGSNPEQLNTPGDIATYQDTLIISDLGQFALKRYLWNKKSQSWQYQNQLQQPGLIPQALAFDAHGQLYIADQHSVQIKVTDHTLNRPLTALTQFGQGPGQFNGIHSLVANADTLYASDAFNQRIQSLRIQRDTRHNTQNLTALKQHPHSAPYDIDYHQTTGLLVTDQISDQITVYSAQLKPQTTLKSPTNAVIENSDPARVISASKDLLVTMSLNDHVLNVLLIEGFYLKSFGTGDHRQFDVLDSRWIIPPP